MSSQPGIQLVGAGNLLGGLLHITSMFVAVSKLFIPYTRLPKLISHAACRRILSCAYDSPSGTSQIGTACKAPAAEGMLVDGLSTLE